MEMGYSFLADYAVVPPDGKVYAMGLGFDNLVFAELPAQGRFAVVAAFRLNAADIEARHEVELRLVDADGKLVVAPATLQLQVQINGPKPEGPTEVTLPTITYMTPTFDQAGVYNLEFWYQARILSSIRVNVHEQQAVAQGPRPN